MKKIALCAALTLALSLGWEGGTAFGADPTPPPTTANRSVAAAQAGPSLAKAKKVHLRVGTGKRKTIKTRATNVAGLLAERKVRLATTDVVTPTLTKKLTNGQKVVVKRVRISTATATERVAAPVIKKPTAKMRRGLSKVLVAGADGRAIRTYTITKVNGKITKKVKVSENILVAPVTRVLAVGTVGKRLNLARLKMWNRIARCESGGRWHINTGNGYYGGLQFNLGTWRSSGGRDFAAKPHKATKAEQITVANRLYAKRGTRPWGGCA